MALFGALIGPVALAWGVQHTGGTGASLMLSLEAVFTALLAWPWYGESVDRRVGVAMLLPTLGGMVLVLDRAEAGALAALGLLAVGMATLAWSADNALSRAVAQRDPRQVIFLKGLFGSGTSTRTCTTTITTPTGTNRCPPDRTAIRNATRGCGTRIRTSPTSITGMGIEPARVGASGPHGCTAPRLRAPCASQ